MRAEIRSKFECTRAQDFPFFYGISQPFKDVDSSGRETRAEQAIDCDDSAYFPPRNNNAVSLIDLTFAMSIHPRTICARLSSRGT